MFSRRSITALLLIVMMIAAGCSAHRNDVPVNEAAGTIAGLTTAVTADNKAQYDYTGKAMEYLERIGTEYRNRMLDGSGEDNRHDAAQEWIISELKAAGYTDDQIVREEFSADWLGTGHNIILTVEGEDPSGQIIAGAHLDGAGVGDNGSGTALLLANAVSMHDIKPHYTIKYIFFDGEEDGCLGSEYNAGRMTDEEISRTIYMINLDCLAFGDYCNIYGGSYGDEGIPVDDSQLRAPTATEAYDYATDTAENLGFGVWRTADLDGYYAKNGTGPEIEEGTFYTNPWTPDNPAPSNNSAMSPSTLPASDHIGYMDRGIEYIYFEATNWFAESENDEADAMSYTGYIETYDHSIGEYGMFMNTEYDTWENLNKYFPGRAESHFHLYSPLLSALLLAEPEE